MCYEFRLKRLFYLLIFILSINSIQLLGGDCGFGGGILELINKTPYSIYLKHVPVFNVWSNVSSFIRLWEINV